VSRGAPSGYTNDPKYRNIVTTMIEPVTFTITDAAQFLGVARQALYRYINAGLLPYVRFAGTRGSRIVKTDLESFLARKVTPTQARDGSHRGRKKAV
jgi:excisionase family DNA binding protein